MPRTKIRKTGRGTKDISVYELAYEDVNNGVYSVRAAAKNYELCHVSLTRYKKKREEALSKGDQAPVTMGYKAWNKVFSENQEIVMAEYIIKAAEIYYGLCPKEVRRFAYEMASKYKLLIPPQWEENKIASEDWFTNFMKRQPQLSIRCAQPTSMSRATSFNETNVNTFFNNLQNVIDKYKFEAKDMYNVDETGMTTVQRPDRIVSKRGTRQVGALTSAERGSLVTVTCAVNAIGNCVPPMFIFPRLRYHEHFVRDGPTGSIGAGNASGWMQENEFLIYLKHFQSHTSATLSHRVLLLMDNHSSHISIQALDYCSENGIVVLSFPPHCSHKLQPLDRAVYGPLKKAFNTGCDAWMRNNPGKTMTIYHIPSVVGTAIPMALTPTNIQAGFRCTGIFPYNRNIFTALDYAPSYITDRPAPLSEISNEITFRPEPRDIEPIPSTSRSVPCDLYNQNQPTQDEQVKQADFTPAAVRPFAKAPPRKEGNRGKKKRKSAVYTDTPEKEKIRSEYAEKQKKNVKKNVSFSKPKAKNSDKSVKSKTKDRKEDSDEEDERYYCLVCLEPFNASRPGEKWVQCMECKSWSHEECTQQNDLYICHNCDSE